ncbi:hypothetical protein [Roseibium sp. RKSG952]|uniref:hypothetical protein n=1 Tax=Roseibium sp. RKSG952 TaxID=2529384 RepID=UPI0012BCF621|nr:hypothetical protein [Roseibium sp. RKSG952]MTH96135.1 hypothetical protein [Roseibium sp. RKSG952]
MKNSTFIWIAVATAYFLAAPLTGRISFNPLFTHWFNPMTYVWWASAWVFWLFVASLVFNKSIFGSLIGVLKGLFKRD